MQQLHTAARVAVVARRAFLPTLGYNGLIVKASKEIIVIDPGIADKFVTFENFLSVFANNHPCKTNLEYSGYFQNFS